MEIVESKGRSADPTVRLQFYRQPPAGTAQLDEIQEACLARLRVLKAIEEAGQDYIKGSKEYVERLKTKLAKLELGSVFLLTSGVHTDSARARKEVQRDRLSHFMLRIAYCRTEELRKWFIAQETDLFRLRFQLEQSADFSRGPNRFSAIATFLADNGISFELLDAEEKEQFAGELLAATHGLNSEADVASTSFYRVHFTEALDLVKARRVFLRNGYAFVSEANMISMVATRFRAHLSQQLAVTCRSLPYLGEDSRLVPLLAALAKHYVSDEWSCKSGPVHGAVLSGQVDQLAKHSFPPCMQQLHAALRKEHHLKHFGRLQYGLFLKGIGLPLEEALKFWRAAFAGKVDGDKFAKEYAYGVRYNYGKEGKRVDFNPYSCVKIITSNPPGPGDSHGCPFRHSEPELLAQRLQAAGVGGEAAQGILARARDSQYQLACRDFFRAVHRLPADYDVAINHPNQYYEESRSLQSGADAAGGRAPRQPAVRVTKVKADLGQSGVAADSTVSSDWLDDTADQELSTLDLSAYE